MIEGILDVFHTSKQYAISKVFAQVEEFLQAAAV
jgi:hypothetical protein